MIRNNSDETIIARLARTDREVEAAQHLRYKVFYEEFQAEADDEIVRARRDFDAYDALADHMIVQDTSLGDEPDAIVGTYRMIRRDVVEKHGRFYTSQEYDIAPMLNGHENAMELGRSCVLPPYRTRPVMQKLWQGIAAYLVEHNITMLFGCGSLHGTDPEQFSEQLAYLYHYHLAPEDIRPRAHDSRYVGMNRHPKDEIDAARIFASLPPLFKGYLRVGSMVGDGAVIDYQMKTTDVCIVLPTEVVTERYQRHYERALNQRMPSQRRDSAQATEFAD
jgi:putative hemolysin